MGANTPSPPAERRSIIRTFPSPTSVSLPRNHILHHANFLCLGTLSAQAVTTFTTCGTCKAVYVLNQNDIGSGIRVRCTVCGNEWHQTPGRLHKLFSDFELEPYDEQKKAHYAKRQKEPRSSQRSHDSSGTRTAGSSYSVFVANLPYKATEQEVAVLFQAVAEDPQVTIVKDNDGRSRGFGFVDLGSNTTVQKAIQTLNGAQVQGREIVVRMGNGRGSR